ncbi:hypothetical protein CK203_005831 [Vitis vinifera]|uniref:Uncharacterized protein n=1 Tax=Vitis vinifera TaxID=29760 RepID=A0A438K4G7_VITVI|nr:hypothetical protein CK203_005831 [Vitis vinifera]
MWVHLCTFRVALVIVVSGYPLHSLILVSIFVPNLDSPSWTRVRGRLTRALDQPDQRLDQRDMDSQMELSIGMILMEHRWPVYRSSSRCHRLRGLRETSYLITLAPSLTDYYSSCTKADMTFLPTRYALETSFPKGHGGWLVNSVPFELTLTASLATTRQGLLVSFILWPDDDDSDRRDIQIVTRSGRVVQSSHLVARPFDGVVSHKEIRIETTTTPKGLIHMMTANRATCIVFSNDDLPLEGSDHTRPLYITVGCLGHRVPSILLDNGSALNVCPLATAIALVIHI